MDALRLGIAVAISAAALTLPASAPAQPMPTVNIALYSYGYAPNPIVLRAGVPVRLVFVNRSGRGHDFTARSFFRHSRILAGAAPRGEIDFAPGQTAAISLIPARGTYRVHCGHFGHSLLGMRTRIVVS